MPSGSGSSAVATGAAAGAATVTAAAGGVNGTSAITVTPPPVVTSVTITPGQASVAVGSTLALTAQARDASGAVIPGLSFSWTSSNSAKATVTPTGVAATVTGGGAEGPATITATAANGVQGASSIITTPPVVTRVWDTFTGPSGTWLSERAFNQTATRHGMRWTTTQATFSTFDNFTVSTVPPVAPALISPASGTYSSVQTVAISTATVGAELRYTTDGSVPTEASALYTSPFAVATGTTVRAVASKTGRTPSAVATAAYLMNFGSLAAPAVTPTTATYSQTQWMVMAIAPNVPGAVVRYTTDGSPPTAGSLAYVNPIPVVATTTVRARAFHPDYSGGAETVRVYTISRPVSVVHVSSNDVGVFTGTTLAISAKAYDDLNALMPAVSFTWSTSNPAIATVVATGPTTATVTGLIPGSVTIAATPSAGPSGTAIINVETSSAVRVYDTFDGASGTPVSSHAPNINVVGQPWVVNEPMPILQNQQLGLSGYNANMISTAMIQTNMADGTIAVDWTPAPASATASGYPLGGLVVRGVDANNYLAIGYGISGGNGLVLSRVVNGVWTPIVTAVPPSFAGHTLRLEVKLDGPNVEVWSDGVNYITATEPMFQTATKHGFRFWTGYDWVSTFDNFVASGPEMVPCAYTLTPSSAAFGPTSGSGVFNGSATIAGCTWYAVSQVSWITVSGSNPGTGIVWYNVGPNTSTQPRHGSILVGDTLFTVTQDGVAPTVPSTNVLYDTFAGDTGTPLTSHSPDINTVGGSWITSGPSPMLHMGELKPAEYHPTLSSTALFDTGSADATIVVNWTPTDASATNSGHPIGALAVRGLDENNYLAVGYGLWAGNALSLAVYDDGEWRLVKEVLLPPLAGVRHLLEVRLTGTRVQVWSDGVEYIDVLEGMFHDGTKHGVIFWPAYDWASGFDNFTVAVPSQSGSDASGSSGGTGSGGSSGGGSTGGATSCPFEFTVAGDSETSMLLRVLTDPSCAWTVRVDSPGATATPANGHGPADVIIQLPGGQTVESLPEVDLEVAGHAITLKVEPTSSPHTFPFEEIPDGRYTRLTAKMARFADHSRRDHHLECADLFRRINGSAHPTHLGLHRQWIGLEASLRGSHRHPPRIQPVWLQRLEPEQFVRT